MTIKRNFSAKRTVTGGCKYRPWKEWKVGDLIIGVYQGTTVDQFDKDNFKFKVFESNFGIEEGVVMGLNECGSLKKAMESVKEGETVQIIYTGEITLDKGKFAGKKAHTCEVTVGEMEDAPSVSSKDEDL